MEDFFEYLKRSLKIAWKSVFFNFKEYSCFFAALFIVQMFYGLMSVSNANNNAVEYQFVTEEYNYHMVLRDLNTDQYLYLKNDSGAVFKNDLVFKIVSVDENKNYMTNRDRYDVYLFFVGKKNESEKRFRESYLPDLTKLAKEKESFSLASTPLLKFDDNQRSNAVTFVFITLILLAVSIFLMTALYNIRINQYKFTYGVYMTFGADFKKLFGTAFWELFVISCVTIVPAVLISELVVALIYIPAGFGFHFSFLAFLWVALFNLAVVLVSVWTPMRIMSVRQPMSLIITEDNSNLVTSPFRSINLLNKKFPTQYEFYSMWRFRKYTIQLLTSAIVFCALFIMGLYYANIYQTDLEYPRPQYTVDLSKTDFYYDNEMSTDLYAMEGVKLVRATGNSMEADEIGSHMIVSRDNVLPFKNQVMYDSDTHPKENSRVTNSIVYNGMTEEQIKVLEQYTYDGDLNSIFTQENTIIIGDSVSNVRTFKWKIGDTVEIARKSGQIKAVDTNLSGRNLLKSQVEYFNFEYETYTIGAIIYDIPSGSMPVFMNVEDYNTVTKKKADSNSIEIYVEDTLTPEQTTSLEKSIRDWGRTLGEVRVVNTHRLSLDNIEHAKHYFALYVCISILILFISPLVWFFNQTLYYFKREKEFNILQSIGAYTRDIRKIYLQGGIVTACLSLVVAVILSYLGSYILFYAFNVIAPYFTSENVRYAFYMPWYAIVISIVMSVGCGFFSTWLPFRSYIKSRFTLENGGAGEGEE